MATLFEPTGERVDPEARRDGDDVHGAGGHEPEAGHGRGAEARVEEVGGVSVACMAKKCRTPTLIFGQTLDFF